MGSLEPPADDCCAAPASSTLLLAVRQFNREAFYECHETLEELWLVESIPLRYFYQGLLQIAVGLHHLRRGNRSGAVSLLTRGGELVRPFAPLCLGIEVAPLLAGVARVLDALETLGLEETREAADRLFPRITLTRD